jgi:hypothetical protein
MKAPRGITMTRIELFAIVFRSSFPSYNYSFKSGVVRLDRVFQLDVAIVGVFLLHAQESR